MTPEALQLIGTIMDAAMDKAAVYTQQGDQGSLQWFYQPNPPLTAAKPADGGSIASTGALT